MRYLIIFFCAVLCAFTLCVTQAEVPKLMNYQGKLTTPQGAPLDTTVSMQFSIYPDSTGGDPLWTESQPSVKVDKGIFNVLLGSVNEIPESVFTGAIRYLGVKVGDDPEMIPRKTIVSVPYAYKAINCDTSLAPDKHFVYFPEIQSWQVNTTGWYPLWQTDIPIDISEYGGPIRVALTCCGTLNLKMRVFESPETEVFCQGWDAVVTGSSVIISQSTILRLQCGSVDGQLATIHTAGVVIEKVH